jgi:hypothetical protein
MMVVERRATTPALVAVLGVLGACGIEQQAPRYRPVASGWGLVMRVSRATEPLVDAAFDQELRGGRPEWLVDRRQARATEKMLLAARSDVAGCFARIAREAAGPIEVAVRFEVDFGGRATGIVVESIDARARTCLTARLRRVRFPDPRPGHRFAVRYVLRFCAPAAECTMRSDL